MLEGVLLKARDAYEEKKVSYLGRLFAFIAFTSEISAAHASHLIEVASQLTYRQLVFLAACSDDEARPALRDSDYRNDQAALKALGPDGRSLLTEIYGLYQQGLLSGESAWISIADVYPAKTRPQQTGGILVAMMGLSAIPARDRQPVIDALK